jgi:RND family efflux transporter MFP subunit
MNGKAIVLLSKRCLLKPLLAVLFVSIAVCSCGKKEEQGAQRDVARPVKILTVSQSAKELRQTYPGTVRASQRVDLAFQVPGTLLELPVTEGQEVKAGDLLARLDPKDFKTNLRNAQGQLGKAEANRDLAQAEYARVLRIREQDPGAVSGSMVDQKREGVNRAEAEIASLQAAVDAAQDQLSYTYLKAPFAGFVATRHVDNYQEVQAKEAIVSLDDISHVEILVDVPETAVFRSRPRGSHLQIFAEFAAAPGKRFPLTLKEFATRADPVTQTYRVTLQMTRPEDMMILPGMTAIVVGVSAREEERAGFIIPAIAVFADEAGESHVWVVDSDTMTVSKRKVTTGEITGTESVQILDGLDPGERIAVSAITQLQEGIKVRDLATVEGYRQ